MKNPFKIFGNGGGAERNGNGHYDPLTDNSCLQPRVRIINPHDVTVDVLDTNGNKTTSIKSTMRVESTFASSYSPEQAKQVVREVNSQKGLSGLLPWNRARTFPDDLSGNGHH